MSELGDRIRRIAKECDDVPELCAVLFAVSGRFTLDLACCNTRTTDRHNLEMLCKAAMNFADGTSTGPELIEEED